MHTPREERFCTLWYIHFILREFHTSTLSRRVVTDKVVTHALDWPSLTVQWFPDKETLVSPSPLAVCLHTRYSATTIYSPADKDYTVHRLLLGTHTSDSDKNYLHIATVKLPKPGNSLKEEGYDESRGGEYRLSLCVGYKMISASYVNYTEIGSHTDTGPRVKITQSITHPGEVNRARYMPQNPDLIATKTSAGDVLVFDRTKHSNFPKDDEIRAQITLKGHTKEGYGMSWNPTSAQKGHILSASEDTTVCHWSVFPLLVHWYI